jgi:hypothetical protein
MESGPVAPCHQAIELPTCLYRPGHHRRFVREGEPRSVQLIDAAATAASTHETTPGPNPALHRTRQCSARSPIDAQSPPANTAADPHYWSLPSPSPPNACWNLPRHPAYHGPQGWRFIDGNEMVSYMGMQDEPLAKEFDAARNRRNFAANLRTPSKRSNAIAGWKSPAPSCCPWPGRPRLGVPIRRRSGAACNPFDLGKCRDAAHQKWLFAAMLEWAPGGLHCDGVLMVSPVLTTRM